MSAISAAGRQVLPGLVGGIVMGVALVVVIGLLGPAVPVVLAIAAIAAYWLISRPVVAVGVLFGLMIVMEEDVAGFLPQEARFYQAIVGGVLSPCDMVFLVAVAAVLLDLVRRDQDIRLPDPFTFPLLLLAGAAVIGTYKGWADGASLKNISFVLRVYLYFLITPVLVMNVAAKPSIQRGFVVVGSGLAIYKGIEGTLAYAAGAGRQIEGVTLTFYEPTATWVIVLFLIGVVAAKIIGARLPWWTLPGWLVTLSALVFSFRRSFWIAAVLGLIVVVVLATGQVGIKRLLPAVVAFAAAAVVAIAFVGTSSEAGLPAPVLERAQSLNPSSLQATKSDRYRITEQRNVVAEIKHHPLTGLGLGVSWTARYPLSATFVGSRGYTHNLVFNYWLKLGILGVIAYFSIMLTALYMAIRVWRSRSDWLIRVGGLTLFGGMLGLIITDLTGSHTGVNLRLTTVFAGALGWMAAVVASERERVRREAEIEGEQSVVSAPILTRA